MDEETAYLDVPDEVAVLLGRLAFYASWLEDILGDAVVVGNPDATLHAESTPNWAWGGERLADAVRAIPIDHEFPELIAARLEALSLTRNQLIHGVWLWKDDSVLVMKRNTGRGLRSVKYGTYTYTQLEAIIAEYRAITESAHRFLSFLETMHPNHVNASESNATKCPNDGLPMRGAMVEGAIVWRCGECGQTLSADPDLQPPTT